MMSNSNKVHHTLLFLKESTSHKLNKYITYITKCIKYSLFNNENENKNINCTSLQEYYHNTRPIKM